MSEQTALTVTPKQRFDDLMERLAPKIVDVLPKHLTAERMTKLMMVEAQRQPAIYQCLIENPASVVGVFMMAAELGLEVGETRQFIHLIPREMYINAFGRRVHTLTAMICYRGYTEMARQSGDVVRINAGVVYRDEVERGLFKWTDEPPTMHHLGSLPPDGTERTDKDIVLAYALAQMKGGHVVQTVMSRYEIEKRHAKSQNESFWGPWYAKMATKTALRSLLSGGKVPLTAPMQRAVNYENEVDGAPEPKTVEQVTPGADIIEADPIRGALGLKEPPAEPEVLDSMSDTERLVAQILELEDAISEAGVMDARTGADFQSGLPIADAVAEDQLKALAYRDELQKRVGGA